MNRKNGSRRAELLVLLDTAQPAAVDYLHHLKPYIEHFGLPCHEWDAGGGKPAPALPEFAAVVLGHRGCTIADAARAGLKGLDKALAAGCGLVSFDPAAGPLLAGLLPSAVSVRNDTRPVDRFTVANNSHYITQLHSRAESLRLKKEIVIGSCCRLPQGEALLESNGCTILEAARSGEGRLVLWHDSRWMSHAIKGPLYGLDDLLWRSLVWAAARPFAMQGLPHFVTMRVDDVWGSARPGWPGDPLGWVTQANRIGLKPWLGLFLYNLGEASISALRGHLQQGTATAFPHAFSANETQVDHTPYIEEWIYFNHWRYSEYNDETMARNARRVEEWHSANRLAIGKLALAHYYEVGRNALPYLIKWGCEFTGMPMAPGEPYLVDKRDGLSLAAGPFRRHERILRHESHPLYYADWVTVEGRPELSGKLYNCLAEVRDVAGYEWAPDNDVAASVDRAMRQLRRCLDSHALAALFTHESDYIQNITPANWQAIMEGIAAGLAAYSPRYTTTEEACRYIRARNSVRISAAEVEGSGVRLEFDGRSDMATAVRLFLDGPQGSIDEQEREVPAVDGHAKVTLN